MKSFYLINIGITAIIAGFLFMAITDPFFAGFRGFTWLSLFFLAALTILIYFILTMAMNMKSHSNFMAAFGVAFATKAIASLLFVSYFIYYKPIANHHFILPFFALYIIYTMLLIWQIWRSTQKTKV